MLLRRRRARASLIDYSRYTNPVYRPAPHHELIAEKLEAVERGECKRLMVFMPPRHGKSELGSRRFPAWFMGRNPERSIIAASYNSELAGDFGRDVRNIVASEEHRALFPTGGLAADSAAAMRWHTSAGGGYAAAGVGTAVTGRGAHVLIVDDPVKDRADADSELLREKTYRWYLSTAYTRLEGTITDEDDDPLWRDLDEAREKGAAFDGAVIVIQTRWHEDDLAGRLLADEAKGADKWDVLSLPAIRQNGQALWPAKYPLARLEAIRRVLPSREWSALYQQSPTPDDGTFFLREWFTGTYRQGEQPAHLTIYITGDFAVTEDGGDWTEFGVWGVDPRGEIYELDWWSGQTNAMTWVERLIDLMQRWNPDAFFGESGVIRRAVEPLLRMRMRARNTFCRLEWLTRTVDKTASARGFQGRAEMKMVHFREGSGAVIDQLIAFPAGKHDDKVDVCTLLGMALAEVHPATDPADEDEWTAATEPGRSSVTGY